MLSFISLWRVGRPSDCISYLQSSTDILNGIIEGKLHSNVSQTTLDNLFGLIATSIAAVKVTVEKSKPESLEVISKALEEISSDSSSRLLLENMMKYINSNNTFKPYEENKEDWLCGKNFNKILMVTLFLPLIDPRTPIIRAEELEIVRQKTDISYSRLGQIEMNMGKLSKKPSVIMEKPRVSPNFKRNFNNFEAPAKKIQPWWESKQFLGNFEKRNNAKNGFASVPRKLRRNGKINHSLDLRDSYMVSPASIKPRMPRSIMDTPSRKIIEDPFSIKDMKSELDWPYYEHICD